MDEKNYFDVVASSFDVTGLGKNSKPWTRYLSLYLLFPLAVMLNFLIWMDFKYKSDIFGIVEVFESVSTFGQHFLRKLTLILFQAKIREVINDTQKFWKIDTFDKPFTDTLYKKLNFAIMQIKLFWVFCFLNEIMFLTAPLYMKSISLPSSCWVPFGNKFLHAGIYFLQCCFICELALLIGPCDGFFLFTCKNIEIQLQLIGRTLQNLKIAASLTFEYQKESLTKLKQCSSYHSFLLKVHDKVGSIFLIYFVLQFIINVIGLTVQFYLFNSSRSDIVRIFKCAGYVVAVIFHGSIYFIPASDVEIEAENLANDIYSLDWYDTPNMKIRKFILFWLMKAQEPLEMSGGGLMKINRNLFLQIPKTSFSIYTLMS